MGKRFVAVLACALGLLLAACGGSSATTGTTGGSSSAGGQTSQAGATITITSTAFGDGQPIPKVYSCDGQSISPPLAWRGVPQTAKSLALIVNDPDAGSSGFIHWVLYNLPASQDSLVENTPKTDQISSGALQGHNGRGAAGYTGPCPPSGVHHYHFALYALDTTLGLSAGATASQLRDAMQGHILGQGELIGTYQR